MTKAGTAPIKSPRLAYDTEVAEYLSIPVGTVRAKACRGELPGVVKLGPRQTRYNLDIIRAWVESKTQAVK